MGGAVSARGPQDTQPSEPGWWLASDGRWYPPESAPGPQHWSAPGAQSWAAPAPARRGSRKRWVIPVIAVAVLVFGGCGAVAVVALRNHSVRETIKAISEGANHFYTAESESMTPAIQSGDRFAATSRLNTIERGEVLVFNSPTPGVKYAIKRVIGLPGDSIEARGGSVFVNGARLAEPYLAAGTFTSDFGPLVVQADTYFLLGDNRMNSLDSRSYGVIDRSEVVAVALRIVTPASHAGPIPGSPRK